MADGEQSVEELQKSLLEYQEQLSQVLDLLKAEPDNAEYQDLEKSLSEVISLTEDLVVTAQQQQQEYHAAQGGFAGAAAAAAAAAAGDGGAEYSTEVPQRPQPSAKHEVYVGVPAPKRLKTDMNVPSQIPKKLLINEDDDEATKARKKKLLKQFKGKQRAAELEAEAQQRAQSWQNFKKGKGAKKQAGCFTNMKKESMFKVPDELGGKVGVIGSGKGMTKAPDLHKPSTILGGGAVGDD